MAVLGKWGLVAAILAGFTSASFAEVGPQKSSSGSAMTERYSAIAWATGHLSYSIASGQPTRDAAEAKAKLQCEQASGLVCTIAASGRDGNVAIGFADDGSRVAMEGKSPAHAAQRVVNEFAGQGRRCTVDKGDHLGGRGAKSALPDMWGTIAYRKDRFPGQVTRVWAVSRMPSQEAAIQTALELCVREEKADCIALAGVRNVHIGLYAHNNEPASPFLESDIEPVRLKAAINFKCKLAVQACVNMAEFEVRKPVMPLIQLRTP
jgi:hypothetical protein